MNISNKASFIRQRIIERNIKGLMKINPEQMETIVQLAEEHEESKGKHDQIDSLRYGLDLADGRDKTSLLVFELEDEAAVPKVFYKGEEITAIVQVDFDWCTRSCEPLSGGMKLNIEHSDKKVKYPNVRQIAHKAGKFAFDDE